MKFADLKDDNPWFQAPETLALKARINEMRALAHDAVVAAVRDNNAHKAAEHVGQHDALGRILKDIEGAK